MVLLVVLKQTKKGISCKYRQQLVRLKLKLNRSCNLKMYKIFLTIWVERKFSYKIRARKNQTTFCWKKKYECSVLNWYL